MTRPDQITIEAPAKINLGLEILGRRDDGYHEIRSVMAMLDLSDSLTIRVGQQSSISGVTGIADEDNLVARALAAFREVVPEAPELSWSLEKRIPVASGLGGASSDAAAALIAANALCNHPLTPTELAGIASTIGSDVPFFLGSPFALSTGRGIDLQPIPPARLNVLLIVPLIDIPHKTSTLYGLVDRSDYSTGGRIDRVMDTLKQGCVPTAADLGNAFSRPLSALVPSIAGVQSALFESGCRSFGLSGAGPAHYVLTDPDSEHALAAMMRARFGEWIRVASTRTRDRALAPTPGLGDA